MYITNNEKITSISDNSSVDWNFINLEKNGKEERQDHLDTVISRHHIDVVKRIKNILIKSQLLIRVNPLDENSRLDIEKVIEDGADIVMLPFLKTPLEVRPFVDYVEEELK